MKKLVITETQLRHLIQEELVRNYLLQEGLWDDVKSGVKKLSKAVTEKFKNLASDWAKIIIEKLDELKSLPTEINSVVDALKIGMKESGESLTLDDNLKAAKELGKINAIGVVESDLSGPVHANAEAMSEAYSVLNTESYIRQKKQLNELGVTAVAGLSLAIVGGLPMLFKGLKKLALALKSEKAAELFEKAEHVTHAVEEKVIDYIVPDKLSYQIYKALNARGFHVSKSTELMSYDDYVKNVDGSDARKKTDGLVYKAMLIYFAFNGLIGVLKAGASLLGFVEGGATAVKGIELAKGAADVSKIVRGAAVAAAETV